MEIEKRSTADFTSTSKKAVILAFICSFLASLFFLLSLILPALGEVNAGRIGVIPWSDAKNWVEGAVQILNGELLTGVPAHRPLYPLFLANIFSIAGVNFLNAIFCQIILRSITTAVAFLILSKIQRDRLAAIFFLTLIIIWKPFVPVVFLTENLGIVILIICITLIWNGLNTNSDSTVHSGLFLFGLSQAVRPWAMFCLLTVPLLPFICQDSWNRKIRQFILYLLLISLGFACHPIATLLFNEPGTGSNYPMTLYGQVAGGLGWKAAEVDPIISKSLKTEITPQELNGVIYKRTLQIFLEKPSNFFIAALTTYKHYFKNIPYAFPPFKLYFLVFFVLFLLLEYMLVRKNLFKQIRSTLVILLSVPFLIFAYAYYLTFLTAVGLIRVVRFRQESFNKFLLLYFLGIILSLPFVGVDGGERVKISSTIFIFLLSAIGFQSLVPAIYLENNIHWTRDKNRKKHIWVIPTFSYLIFIVLPYFITVKAGQRLAPLPLPTLESSQIKTILNLEEDPISPAELSSLNKEWPQPSFEKIRNNIVYVRCKYADRNAVFLNADAGINIRQFEFWPLGSISPKIARTVHVPNWTIFPNTDKKMLKRFDNQEIIVLGRAITSPRRWKYDTGLAIWAQYIGYLGPSRELEWLAVSNL